MSAPWSISNRGSAGGAATVSLSAPSGGASSNLTARLRALQCSVAGTAAGTDQLVVRDGATGAGTIIWSQDLSVPANGYAGVNLADLDLRASPGNALTVEFVNGVASDREDVNAQGDWVTRGAGYGV